MKELIKMTFMPPSVRKKVVPISWVFWQLKTSCDSYK